MASDPSSRPGAYLPTGWRVVGAGADRLIELAAARPPTRLQEPVRAHTLFAVQCTMEPAARGRPAVEHILDALTAEIRAGWPECPRLVRDEELHRAESRYSGLRYEFEMEPGRAWSGEIIWRTVHPVVAGAPITTRVFIEERAGFTRLSVRVSADDGLASVRGFVGAGQAQPGFLRLVASELQLVWLGAPLAAKTVRRGGVPELVRSVLESSSRDYPVVILAPREEGGYVVPPEEFARDLLGRGELYVLDHHDQTFELTDTVGDRQMSCFRGAVRAYMPGWSRHDNPFDHPLLLGNRLDDPVMRATWLGELSVWMGQRTTMPPALNTGTGGTGPAPEETAIAGPSNAQAVTSSLSVPVTETHAAPVSQRITPPGPTAPVEEPVAARAAHSVESVTETAVSDVTPLLQQLVAEVRGLGSIVERVSDELERLRLISAVRSSSTNVGSGNSA